MEDGGVRTALVGSADMCTAPLSAHRARIGVDPDTVVGEGSHWFLLATGRREADGLGVVRAVRSVAGEAELLHHVRALSIDPEDAVLALGPSARPELSASIAAATGICTTLAYDRGVPWYDSRTGQGLHAFLTAAPARTLVHIDADPAGRLALLVVEATSPAAPAPTRPPREPRNDR
jgi:hypothetical protein